MNLDWRWIWWWLYGRQKILWSIDRSCDWTAWRIVARWFHVGPRPLFPPGHHLADKVKA